MIPRRRPRRRAPQLESPAPAPPSPATVRGTATAVPRADDRYAARGAAGSPGSDFRGPLESVLRHPGLSFVPLVLLVAAAVAIGLTREPVHTAEARVNVGRVDVPAYTLQGVTIGNATLAASYARAAEASAVLEPAARAAGISVSEARAQIFASQVPNSTLISVAANGSSARESQALANGAAKALIAYVSDLNTSQKDSDVVERYRAAQLLTDRARRRLARLEVRLPESSPEYEEARLELLTRQLRSQSLSTRVVQGLVEGTASPPPRNLLQLVVPAETSSSDASSILQRLVLIGLAAGLLIGIALALLRSNWELLRRARG